MVMKSLQFYSPGYPTTLYYGLLSISVVRGTEGPWCRFEAFNRGYSGEILRRSTATKEYLFYDSTKWFVQFGGDYSGGLLTWRNLEPMPTVRTSYSIAVLQHGRLCGGPFYGSQRGGFRVKGVFISMEN